MSRRERVVAAVLAVVLALAAMQLAQAASLSSLAGGGWWTELVRYQGSLHRQLAAALRGLREGDPVHAAWALGSLSLLYGVVHAVRPGHGKAVISSYLLADGQTIRSGIVLSFAAALAQAVSAVGIVLIGSVLMGLAGFQLNRVAAHAETASFALVAALGVGMALTGARRLAHHRRRDLPWRAQALNTTRTSTMTVVGTTMRRDWRPRAGDGCCARPAWSWRWASGHAREH